MGLMRGNQAVGNLNNLDLIMSIFKGTNGWFICIGYPINLIITQSLYSIQKDIYKQ